MGQDCRTGWHAQHQNSLWTFPKDIVRVFDQWDCSVLPKVWINKNEPLKDFENRVTSTILIQSSWSSSNLKYQWGGYFDKVSYEMTKNYWFYTIFHFWGCLIFYDSDFKTFNRVVEFSSTFLDWFLVGPPKSSVTNCCNGKSLIHGVSESSFT